MFQFTGFASPGYVFTRRYRRSGGLPHSEIHGSKLTRSSPRLIAACHVLHRLLTPRHPPDALLLLERSAATSRTGPAIRLQSCKPARSSFEVPTRGHSARIHQTISSLHTVQRTSPVTPKGSGSRIGNPIPASRSEERGRNLLASCIEQHFTAWADGGPGWTRTTDLTLIRRVL